MKQILLDISHILLDILFVFVFMLEMIVSLHYWNTRLIEIHGWCWLTCEANTSGHFFVFILEMKTVPDDPFHPVVRYIQISMHSIPDPRRRCINPHVNLWRWLTTTKSSWNIDSTFPYITSRSRWHIEIL